MKKIYILLMLVFAFTSNCFSELLISKVIGKVEISKAATAKSSTAKIGQILEKEDSVRTRENGRIELIYEDGSAIWLKENSEIKVASLIYGQREILMNRGKIRLRVTPLKPDGRFSLKTPTAVAAVRGTEFIMLATETDSSLLVLSGKVEIGNLILETGAIPGAAPRYEVVSEGQKSVVTQKGEVSPPQEFSKADLGIINDNSWQKFETEEPEKKSGIEKEKEGISDLKKELQKFVQDTRIETGIIDNIVREVRQSDFSTARTMRDINGNVVRVEQNLLRPDANTVEFLNLTQRDSYVYNGKFDYTGPATKRTDYIDAKIIFNKGLPSQITEWPNFIQSQAKDSLYPTEINVEIANRTDVKNHYFKIYGKRDAAGKINTNFYVSPDGKNEYKIFEPTSDDKKSDASLVTISKDGNDIFWSTTETPFFLGDSNGNKSTSIVWLKNEFYGINNNGGILDMNYFLGSQGKDPFSILKEIATETIISVKKDARNGSDYFGKNGLAPNNLDLVWTPDLVITIVQKLASQISNISSDVKTPTSAMP